MVISALCKNLQRLRVTAKHVTFARDCWTRASGVASGRAKPAYAPRPEMPAYEPNLRAARTFSPIPELGLPSSPASASRISESPPVRRPSIAEPSKVRRALEDSVPERSLDLPASNGRTSEKRAITAIVIRRHKMRRHKLKKLRKKMHFAWAKVKQRREMAKEKAFHAELLGQIKKAEKFDPETYIERRFAVLDKVRWPNKYRGVEMPEWQVREFLLKEREKRAKKFNKPRLTL